MRINQYRSRLAMALFVLGLTLISGVSLAGAKTTIYVTIDDATSSVMGSLGSAYNSADNTQYLGCYSFSNYGMCMARDVNGINRSCATTDAEMISVIRSLSGDSILRFEWDSNGNCRAINSSHFSHTRPKKP